MNQLVNRIKSIKSNYPAECGNERKCGCFFTTLNKQYTIESEKEDERTSVCLNQSQKFATTKTQTKKLCSNFENFTDFAWRTICNMNLHSH